MGDGRGSKPAASGRGFQATNSGSDFKPKPRQRFGEEDIEQALVRKVGEIDLGTVMQDVVDRPRGRV